MITRTISQKPTKIDSEVQADWEENNPNSAAFIRHKPKLAPVATSGNYDDLLNKLQAGDGVIIDGDTIFARPDNVTVELNNKGELSVIGGSTLQAGDGIEIDQGTIFAKPDNVTIDFNEQGQLSVINGSTLEAGGGIAIDDGTIFARPDNKTIIIDEDGALAAIRNPDDGGTPFEGGDGIEINRVDNTISAKVDNKTIIINTDGALAAVEGTTLEAGEGISIDQGTIHVRPDNITIDFNEEGKLSVVSESTALQAGDGIEIDQGTIFAKVDNDTITLNQEGQLTAVLPDISRNAVFNAELSSNGWDIADLVGKIQETGISTAINTIAAGKGDAWVAAGNDIWYCRDNTFKIWEKATTNVPSNIAFPGINEVTYVSELGLFIAVGYRGSILLSNNASNWMVIYMDSSDEDTVLTSAAYGNGTFVVVGENGVILTSNNGLKWKDHSLPEELKSNLNSVVYSDNKFKIVTAIGIILSSQDGKNWIGDTSPSTLNSINDVAYGNDKFVAVGDRGQILTCPSTSNAWSLQDIATEENFSAVACCDDLSVAVGGHGTIFVNNGTSNDWKKIDHDSIRSFTDVIYDEKNELFIISSSSQEVVIAKAILQQVAVTTPEGLTAEDVVVAGVVTTDLESTHELLEWNKINLIDTGDNRITAQCGVHPPKTNLKIQLKL